MIADSFLAVHAVLFASSVGLKAAAAHGPPRCRGAGVDDGAGCRRDCTITFASAIDDPARFKSSKQVGAHFGMTPKKYQSGETDITGRISKIGDKGVRTALYQAAHIVLTRPVKGSALKSWAMKLAKRVDAEGESGARPQACRHPAPHAG